MNSKRFFNTICLASLKIQYSIMFINVFKNLMQVPEKSFFINDLLLDKVLKWRNNPEYLYIHFQKTVSLLDWGGGEERGSGRKRCPY